MSTPPDVSLILPTYNEAENLPILLQRLAEALKGRRYEIIVVDDNSPDRTWDAASRASQADDHIQVIRRFEERGLSSAVLTGMSAARGLCLAVMDADLQHDERILPQLIDQVLQGEADIAVGSRGAEGGDYGAWSRRRRLMSWAAAFAARLALPIKMTDPMSGYFVISREVYRETAEQINPRGFKILLEFVGRGPRWRIRETGYSFRNRIHGETKLSPSVIRNYFVALYDLRFGRLIPPSFLMYGAVGASGVLVNLIGLQLGELLGLPHLKNEILPYFGPIYLAAVLGYQLAILTNYVLNNYFTFWERRRRGWDNVSALLVFQAVSMLGFLVYLAVFHLLQANGFLLGALSEEPRRAVNAIVGTLVAMVTNYYLNISFTWKSK
ncbi:MAG: glycosyltransferase family 2 protein [Leptospirales bacterium]|nr:glycosyltransferase family 2 protein [Leptospirales bacterium]